MGRRLCEKGRRCSGSKEAVMSCRAGDGAEVGVVKGRVQTVQHREGLVVDEETTTSRGRSQAFLLTHSLTRTDCPGLVFSQACHKIPAKTGCLSFRSINGSSCFNCECERGEKFSLAAEQGKEKFARKRKDVAQPEHKRSSPVPLIWPTQTYNP